MGMKEVPRLVVPGKRILGLGKDKLPEYRGAMKEILDEENFRINPYRDSRGFVTGGIGHLFTKEDYKEWDPSWPVEKKVDYWVDKFRQDYKTAQAGADRIMKEKGIEDIGKVRDVLVQMNFNMGERRVKGFTGFLQGLKDKNPKKAEYEMKHKSDGSKTPWYTQAPDRVEQLAKYIRESYEPIQ